MSTMPTSDQVEAWVEQQLRDLRIAEPVHSYGDTPITHVLNVARRNGTPPVPKHCACADCINGLTHSMEATDD